VRSVNRVRREVPCHVRCFAAGIPATVEHVEPQPLRHKASCQSLGAFA
jgi:hypothetical protein